MICIGLLLASCGGEKQPKSTVAAIESGEKTRMEWQKARKPVEIHIEGMEGNTSAWPNLGVYMDVNATTPEERQAFAGAVFTLEGDVYVSANRNAVTSDTMATISVCFPFRKGMGANDTLRLTAPFGENLYGVEIRRSIGNAIEPTFRLQSSMALLRIVCGSDDLRDRLDGITLIGDDIYTAGCYQPYTGRWLDKEATGGVQAESADCLLNNGRKHDLYLIPTGTACSTTIIIRTGGKDHALRTMLPPLTAGSMTHLSIRKDSEGVAINGSWVETERGLAYEHRMMPVDSVQTGHYLQKDGTIQAERDTLSIAVVVETDGKYGKAVALSDSKGLFVFSGNDLSSGRRFPTIDGTRKEGVINPTHPVQEDAKIIYKPGMPYSDDCALGYARTGGSQWANQARLSFGSANHAARGCTASRRLCALIGGTGQALLPVGMRQVILAERLDRLSGRRIPHLLRKRQGYLLSDGLLPWHCDRRIIQTVCPSATTAFLLILK